MRAPAQNGDGGLPAGPDNGKVLFLRFLQVAGISQKDLTEAAFCLRQSGISATTPGSVRYLIAVAGTFKPGRLVNAVKQNSPAAQYKPGTVAGMPALRKANGKLLAQAPDGTIFFSDDEAMVASAEKATDKYKAYALSGDVSLWANEKALKSMRGTDARHPHPLAQLFGDGQRAQLTMDSKTRRLHLEVMMPDVRMAAVAQQRLNVTAQMFKPGTVNPRLVELLPAGTLEAVSSAVVTSKDRTTIVDMEVPLAALHGFFHRVALFSALGG
jgi:hypothetical protein